MNKKEQIEVLKKTIEWFKKQIEPHDCGWIYTTIDGLKHRIKYLIVFFKTSISSNLLIYLSFLIEIYF